MGPHGRKGRRMTPAERIAAAKARRAAIEATEREQAKAALKRKQARLREQTKRDSKMPRKA